MPDFNARLSPMPHTRMKISIMLICILTLCLPMQGQEDPDGYISIDCGAQNDYPEGFLNLHYKTDAGFIDTGENMQVSTEAIYKYEYQYSKNLRIFPNGTRNCYTLQPKQGKGNTYLVRATFWYGNYDGKNQTPVFDLYIDTNYWSTVKHPTYYYEEVTYFAPRDHIQVCLINIGLGVPFISALELRPFLNSTYKMPSSGTLRTRRRFFFGSNSSYSYRYPQDDYDRIWLGTDNDGLKSVTNTTPIATPTSNNTYKLPEGVLTTAVETSNISDNLELNWTITMNNVTNVRYAYIHFAEVQDLVDQVREMDVYVGTMEGGYEKVDTVSLRNQNPSTLVGTIPGNGQNIKIKLEATAQSSLPPLLNALEIFEVLSLPYPQTDVDDFYGINDTKTTYGIVKESWQGDPCVPQNMTWEGLSCSYYNDVPRIISLNLSSSKLSGIIAASFSNLTAMASLDLSNNGLEGPLPAFFAEMPNLKFINLSGNHLNGSIPEQLKKRQKDGTLQLTLEGNLLCQTESCQRTRKKSIAVPVAVSIASVIGLIILGILVKHWWLDKHKLAFTQPSSISTLKGKIRAFTYSEVVRITNNFDTIIGEGGFGKVYLGTLDNDNKVAVKMLSLTSKQGYKEFETEAQLLMVVHHKNLVSLVGYCDDIKNIALIYGYMPAGSLKDHLSGKNPNALSWIQRLQIGLDAAEGLNYLHHGCKPPIIHRDLKSSNILLNENMQAKIADFGLSKVFEMENESCISTRLAGTPGYVDPEFQSSGNLSKKSDVYSFGIILFELITGHSAILRGPNGNTHVLNWVAPFIQRGDIESIMDPRLKGQFSINSARKAIEIAVSCVPATAIQRPDINIVLQELKECLDGETSSPGTSQTYGIYKRSGSHESFSMSIPELDSDIPSARL